MFTADRKHMTEDFQQQLDRYSVDWRVVFIGVNLVAGYYARTIEGVEIASGVSDKLRQMRQDVLRVALGRVA